MNSLKEMLSKKYLDTDNAIVEACALQPDVIHKKYTIAEKKGFLVVSVNNIFSTEEASKLMNMLNKVRFMNGAGGIKSKGFVRVASSVGTPFTVSNGDTVYDCVPFEEVDKLFFKYFKKVASLQREVIEVGVGKEFLDVNGANTIHYLVGHSKNAKYAYLSDYSPMLCSDAKEEEHRIYSGIDNVWLPTRSEQQTFTFVFSNCKNTPSSKLIHKDEGNNKVLGHLEVGNNSLHIQLAGSQTTGIVHKSETVKGAVDEAGTYRVVVTFQNSILKEATRFQERFQASVGNSSLMQETYWHRTYNHDGVLSVIHDITACSSGRS